MKQLFLRRRSAFIVLLLLGLAFALTGLEAHRTPPMDPDQECCDHLFYRSMAYNLIAVTRPELNEPPPGSRLWEVYSLPYYSRWMRIENRLNRQPHYVYRIVSPLLARAIALLAGDNIDIGFYTLSFGSLALTCFVLSLTIYTVSSSLVAAVLAAVSLSQITQIFAFNLYDYILTDPLAFLLVALSVYLMVRRRERWFFLVALVGVFNKEIHLLVLPCYLLMQLAQRRLTRSAVLSSLAVVCIYFLFRASLGLPDNAPIILSHFVPPTPGSIATGFFGIFGVLAISGILRAGLARSNLWLMPLALGGVILALFPPTHVERTYILAFPLVFMSTFGLRLASLPLQVSGMGTPILFLIQRMSDPAWSLPFEWSFVILGLVSESIFLYLYFARTKHIRPRPLARATISNWSM